MSPSQAGTPTHAENESASPQSRLNRIPINVSALLGCGIAAGPLFVATAVAQMATREGFDLRRQPLSLLSLGDHGWIQVANFIVAGLLVIAGAVGVRRALTEGRGHRWAPRLLTAHGLGLVAGGALLPDPGLGFPPGTPDGIPDHLSWHGLGHAFAPPLSFLALVVACLVMARRFRGDERQGWAAYSVATAAAALGLAAIPGDGMGVRLFIAIIIGFAWFSTVLADLRRDL